MKIKDWLIDTCEPETIQNIAQHGCVSGACNALIYYDDTVKFHDDFETEIWDRLYQDAQDFDMNIPQFIASLNGAKDVGSIEQFKNLLTWYAVEQIANEIINESEAMENE